MRRVFCVLETRLEYGADDKAAGDRERDAHRIKQPHMRPCPTHPLNKKREQQKCCKKNQRQELLNRRVAQQKRAEEQPGKCAAERNRERGSKRTCARFFFILQGRSPPQDRWKRALAHHPNPSSHCARVPASSQNSIRRGMRPRDARKRQTAPLDRRWRRRRAV